MEASAARSKSTKLFLIRDGFVSEIVHGRATGLYHYLVTTEASPEILCWGQEDSLEAARHSIDEFINSETSRHKIAG